MLRFLRDRLHIGLEPHRLSLVRLAGNWRPAVVSARSMELSPGANLHSESEAFQRELSCSCWQGTQAHIVLADSMARYFIAPLPSGVRNLRETRLAAQIRFEEIFGDDAKDWAVELSATPFATLHLACAVRLEVIESIKRACREAKIFLNSIAPLSIHEFNRNHRRIGYRSGWVAVIGPQTLWTGFKHGRDWHAAQVRHLQPEAVVDLPSLLARDALRAGIGDLPEKRLWVSGRAHHDGDLPWLTDPGTYRLDATGWPGQSEEWSRSFRLALSPVWPACA